MVQQSAVQFQCPATPSTLLLCPSTTTSANPGPLFDMSGEDSEASQDNSPCPSSTCLPLFNATFPKYSPFPVWKSSSEEAVAQKQRKRAVATTATKESVMAKKKKPSSSFDILHSTLTRPPSSISSSLSSWQHSKGTWNTSSLTKDTLFVLDSHANKWLEEEKEIAVSHPELIRYPVAEEEDLHWLVSQSIIPTRETASSVTAVQLLVRDEVVKLKRSQQPDWSGDCLVGFKTPEFMLRKMHKHFTELSLRNQRLRTHSGYFDTISSGSGSGNVRSTLSTSHATLSALLANCTDAQD